MKVKLKSRRMLTNNKRSNNKDYKKSREESKEIDKNICLINQSPSLPNGYSKATYSI